MKSFDEMIKKSGITSIYDTLKTPEDIEIVAWMLSTGKCFYCKEAHEMSNTWMHHPPTKCSGHCYEGVKKGLYENIPTDLLSREDSVVFECAKINIRDVEGDNHTILLSGEKIQKLYAQLSEETEHEMRHAGEEYIIHKDIPTLQRGDVCVRNEATPDFTIHYTDGPGQYVVSLGTNVPSNSYMTYNPSTDKNLIFIYRRDPKTGEVTHIWVNKKDERSELERLKILPDIWGNIPELEAGDICLSTDLTGEVATYIRIVRYKIKEGCYSVIDRINSRSFGTYYPKIDTSLIKILRPKISDGGKHTGDVIIWERESAYR